MADKTRQERVERKVANEYHVDQLLNKKIDDIRRGALDSSSILFPKYLHKSSHDTIAGKRIHHHELVGNVLAILRPNFCVYLLDYIHVGDKSSGDLRETPRVPIEYLE